MKLRILAAGILSLFLIAALGGLFFDSNNGSQSLSPLSIELTPLESRRVQGVSYVLAHPMPNSTLKLEDYNRGMQRPGVNLPMKDTYNICILSEPLAGRNKACNLPGGRETPCPTFPPPARDDFFRDVEIVLDGKQINGGRIGENNTLEIPDSILVGGYYLCYRMPLSIGTHRLRYTFHWQPGNIADTAEWEFTLVD
ncbi:hypothetical protein ANRL4_01287 [Anaerolineae bacterium]|nr:hypothetical protein ANRL4_01287 [Anaerolineae bacterium]